MAKNMNDPRNWAKWRNSGAMEKSSDGVFHLKGKEGSICGHVGKGIEEPSEFAKKSKKECCLGCWAFAKASGLVEQPRVRHFAWHGAPLNIPRRPHYQPK